MLQPDPDSPRKARPALHCSECGKPAPELYIVRVGQEICIRCVKPSEVARYPEFQAMLKRLSDPRERKQDGAGNDSERA